MKKKMLVQNVKNCDQINFIEIKILNEILLIHPFSVSTVGCLS